MWMCTGHCSVVHKKICILAFIAQGWHYIGDTSISDRGLDGAEVPPPVASIHWHWSHCAGVRRVRLCRVSDRLEGAEARETIGTSPKIATVCIV